MPPSVFTIDADRPFLDTLVAGLRAASADPLALSRQTILLPTRRAARALAEAFLRASEGRALLLPRLVPVGDVDAEELTFGDGDGFATIDIPPAIPPLRRALLLTRLVLRWAERKGDSLSAGQGALLAGELARFLDEVQTEGCDLAALDALVPADHAAHWQQVLDFLGILREHWPAILDEAGTLDPAARRNRVLAAQAEAWRRHPPAHPIIAAGLTGGVAAVADLVAAVASLPRGTVVLPGLDRGLDDESWAAIAADPAHPQHLLAGLLRRLEITPDEVRPWPAPGRPARTGRLRLIAEAMRPASQSDRWRSLGALDVAVLDGFIRLDCVGAQEEAGVIALLLRQALETADKTAALVTPDRGLARRVAAELRRWSIEIDDSAGVPLEKSPPGVFLRLMLDAVVEDFAPLPLLALLKHPLAAGGRAPEDFRATVRRLEIAALRGARPAPGFAGLRAVLPAGDALHRFVDDLEMRLAPLVAAIAEDSVPLTALVHAHIATSEALAAAIDEDGAGRLWREDAGEAAATFMADLLHAAESFGGTRGRDYQAFFGALLAGQVVRPRFGRHARLAIWGLLEARLQHADLIVLGGLNEGTWPPRVESDPWLSRPMRRAFGLPAPERHIGAAAHDFVQALGAAQVVLTRARRVDGTPAVPSRWLLRLETVLRAGGLEGRLGALPEPLLWQARLDEPEKRRVVAAPEPRPPVVVRPRRLSVTAIETWMRDPYALYAREVLRLAALEPIDADPGAAERGIFIHRALERFIRAFPGALPGDAEAQLIAIGKAEFGATLERPGMRTFWWPRFERIARWFVAHERVRRQGLTPLGGELAGELRLHGPAGPFILSAKADRIDRDLAGGLVLVDYKTGGLPPPGEVELGFSPQLPLEAAIAASGGFAGVPPGPVAALEYWRLGGGNPPAEVVPLGENGSDVRRLLEEALAGLAALIAEFDDPRTPYRAMPRPERAPRYSDYLHLARVKEWSVVGEEGE
ncbi:MAG TPA: double-strand break repair protein AddB [Stellaceae bacterium]|nr:double-strand break repair protein AddB [Stellaceae bacterium]